MNAAFTYKLSQLTEAAGWLIRQAADKKIIALYGEMGMGKTTLAKEIVHRLGSNDMVQSPTYSLVNEYALPDGNRIYHMDWYRLKDEEEAFNAGIDSLVDSGHYCIVEWPEKFPGLLDDDETAVFKISFISEDERKINLE